MKINTAEFVKSSSRLSQCPKHHLPEHALVGRSNVGKSSLINYLTNKKRLVKISSTPGKTNLINHFLIDNSWYVVDLPGYGWAKVSKSQKNDWIKMMRNYLQNRKELLSVFLLIDIRHKPLKIDLDFIQWLGESQIPFSILFTKADKIKKKEREDNVADYKKTLLKTWEETPPMFITSSEKKIGKEKILDYINSINKSFV